MASGKNTTLAITISTVDKATGKLKAINAQLDAMTKPTRDFKKALGELGEKSGLDNVVSGFKGVGSAIGDLLGKVAMIAGVAGVAVAGLIHISDEYAVLGKTAKRLGVGADFLAGLRDAAERTGVPIESLDDSLSTFAVNLGKAQVGAGRMAKFLPRISTVNQRGVVDSEFGSRLLRQLTAAKGTAAAIDVLSTAMSKLKDPEDRAALAAATLGDAKLAPLFEKGPKAIKELIDHYNKLAPGQQAAADAAMKLDKSQGDLHASLDGVKGALVVGLGPAIDNIVQRMTVWLTAHQADIKQWAEDIGKKLPGAVDAVVEAVKKAVKWVVDIVDKIGGLKTVAIGAAAIVAGPLLSAITSLGLALLTTIGRVAQLAKGIGALPSALPSVAGGAAAAGEGSALAGGAKAVGGGVLATVALPFAAGIAISHYGNKYIGHESTASKIARLQLKGADDPDQVAFLKQQIDSKYDADYASGPSPYDVTKQAMDAASGQANRAAPPQVVQIALDITGAPKGTRVTTDTKGKAEVDLSVGYNFGFSF